MRLWPGALIPLAVVAQPALAAEPVYQAVADAGCEVVDTYEAGGTSICHGPDGTPFMIDEGDLRFSVTFGGVEEGARPPFNTFGPFNDLGATIEWQVEGGRPIAAILRSLIYADEDAQRGSVLIVYKVGEAGSPGCIAAYVDTRANTNANELAREAADTLAPNLDCATHVAEYVGTHGPTAPEPIRWR